MSGGKKLAGPGFGPKPINFFFAELAMVSHEARNHKPETDHTLSYLSLLVCTV